MNPSSSPSFSKPTSTTTAAADLKDELLMWAQELDDSLHGIVRKNGKIISRMGGIPADFGWQMRTGKQSDLLKKAAKALEAQQTDDTLSELRTQIEEEIKDCKAAVEDGSAEWEYRIGALNWVIKKLDSAKAEGKE